MNRLKEIRVQNKITQEELGRLLGVQKAAICKYETGRVAIPGEMLVRLCDYFKVSSDYLLGRSNKTRAAVCPVRETVGIPVVGRVHAGLPMLASENIEEYIATPADEVTGGEYFFMEVEGDCMIGANIPEGALVLVRKQSRVENGQIAVIRIEDEVLLRKVKWIDGHLMLIPANPQYEPIILAGGDIEIIGRVLEARIRGF